MQKIEKLLYQIIMARTDDEKARITILLLEKFKIKKSVTCEDLKGILFDRYLLPKVNNNKVLETFLHKNRDVSCNYSFSTTSIICRDRYFNSSKNSTAFS